MPRFTPGSRACALAVLLALTLITPVFAQEAARSLSRYVPARDRITVVEFQGFDRHADGWRRTALYKLLNTTKLGALLEDLAAQAIDASRQGEGQDKGQAGLGGRLSGRETVTLLERVAQKGWLMAYVGTRPEPTRAAFVFRDGADAALRPMLESFAASLAPPKSDRRTVQKAGRTLVQWGQGVDASTFWTVRGDAIVCQAATLERILAAIEGKEPAGFPEAIWKPEAGFEPVAIAHHAVASSGKLPPSSAALGLDRLRSVDVRWGFQDDAIKAEIQLEAPGPRRGILALFDQPGFTKDSLPVLPAGQGDFLVLSLDPASSFDRVVAMMKASKPAQAAQLDGSLQALWQALGVDLRKELLPHLGPYWSVYGRPASGQPAALPLINTTILMPIDDQAAVTRALRPVMAVLEQQLAQGQRAPNAEAPRVREGEGPNTSFTLELPPAMQPAGPVLALSPTLMIGKRQLILAGRRDAAEAALALVEKDQPRWKPTGAFVPMARQLPAKMVLLNVSDPRTTLPGLIASLPQLLAAFQQAAAQRPGGAGRAGAEFPIRIDPAQVPGADELSALLFPGSLAVITDAQRITIVSRSSAPSPSSPATMGVAVGLLLPAVQAAREAARRTQCVNNLRQIGLGLHNYHAVYGVFPRRAVTDRNGKPLLSWRVTILPFIGQQELYKKFKLDEPWDSPHNRQLLEAMPAAYTCPSRRKAEPFTTAYRAFGGPLSLLQVGSDVRTQDVVDGTANTLAVVEAAEAVPWTKPDDLPFDPEHPTPQFGAGSSHAGGFNALFADGSVRFLKLTINPDVLRALVTRAGREPIPADAF